MNIILNNIILILFVIMLFGIGLHINSDKECTKNYYVPIFQGDEENELKVDPLNFTIEEDTDTKYVNIKTKAVSLNDNNEWSDINSWF